MSLSRRLIEFVGDVLTAWLSTPPPVVTAAPEGTHKVHDGWPPFYDRAVDGAGKYVVVVTCARTGQRAATSLPAWSTEEECRADVWERHAYDPKPELM